MTNTTTIRRVGVLIGGVAIAGAATWMAGCSTDRDNKEPTKTPEPTQQSPSPSGPPPSGPPASPTEKAPTLTPGGPNSFTPTVIAPPAPTALPGNVITGQ